MSFNVNTVMLGGRLTRDPETKPIGERCMSTFGLAVNRTWKDKAGQQKEEVAFIDVTCWGYTAEAVRDYLAKGMAVYVEGHLKMDQWKTKDGQARQMLKVEADRVHFINGKKEEAAPPPVAKKPEVDAEDPF